LKLKFERTELGVIARFTPRRQDEGFFGIVHGGIVTTMLDEAMAWATYASGAWAMTAKMEVRFRKPVEVGAELVVIGRIESVRGKIVTTAGEIRHLASNAILAEATATFIKVPEAAARTWEQRYFG
ncbi:MAG: PaaI family thioesterase, partial [Thermomicrobiales bacterium]